MTTSPANGPTSPLSELAPKVQEMGFDGVDLACWGGHFVALNAAAYQGPLSIEWHA